MPLFIDLHIDHSLTSDLVKKCHVADKAIQDKYGVRYLQILLNEPQGYLFCLIEAPDKEACAKVHQHAHGNIACNVLEITQTDFSALLANKPKNAVDFTLNHDGTLDTGTRAILVLSLLGPAEYYQVAIEMIRDVLQQHDGRNRESLNDQMEVVFDSCSSAIDAGIAITEKMTAASLPMEVRMGVSMGPPLEEKGNFFEDVRRSASHFSFVSLNGQISVSSKAMQLYAGKLKDVISTVKVINPADEKFLKSVMQMTEKLWNKNEVSIEGFAREVGMSKSQLTRKLKVLTNLTPNDFIKEFRLRKSIQLMDQNLNIAEVTMAIGFSNPSYFTKCFRKRFGKAPSEFTLH